MSSVCLKSFILVWIIFSFHRCSYSIEPCPCDGHRIFLTEPRDVTAKEGDNVSFSCTVNISSYLPIEWEVNPDKPMKEWVQQKTTSRLLIYNIGRVDYYITCKVYHRPINDQRTCFHRSRRAKVTVQYFPREDELTCGTPNRSLSVQEGDSFHIHCQVTRGNPPVDIGWSIDGKTFRQKPGKNDGLIRTSAQIIKVTRAMHGLYFTCVVTSEVAFPGEEIICSIGPLDVYDELSLGSYESGVSLEPSPGIETSDYETISTCSSRQTAGSILSLDEGVIAPSPTIAGIADELLTVTYSSVAMEAGQAIPTSPRRSTIIVISVLGSGLILISLLANTYVLVKYILKKRARNDHSYQVQMDFAKISRISSSSVLDHSYEDPDKQEESDTANHLIQLGVVHTSGISSSSGSDHAHDMHEGLNKQVKDYTANQFDTSHDSSPSPRSTNSSDSNFYLSRALSSDAGEEYYQSSTKLPEITDDSSCSSIAESMW